MIVKRFAKFVISNYAKLFYHHKVYGVEHLPKGGAIIACNHVSYLDPPLVGISTKESIHFMARSSLFRYPGFGWLLRQLSAHPVKKGEENSTIFKLMLKMLREDKKVVLFPEGKRAPHDHFIEPEAGVGVLALHARKPIVPTYVHGTYEIWGSHRGHPKMRGKTACIFGTPLYFDGIPISDRREKQLFIAKQVMASIVRLKEWYLAGCVGSPP